MAKSTAAIGTLILLILAVHPSPTFSQTPGVVVDGAFSDWQHLSPLHLDPPGDRGSGDYDFGRLWVTHNDRLLFLRIEIGHEINLQSKNDIRLFLDTDNNPETGMQIHGIGAELEWNFGYKPGLFVTGTDSVEIVHSDIGLATSPTVSSTEFEIALDRLARPDGRTSLFPGKKARIVFATSGGDVLPDRGKTVAYTIGDPPLPPSPPLSLQKQSPEHLRVLSYNVWNDGLFDDARLPSFARILTAIKPDIIGFQEIDDYTAEQTAARVDSIRSLAEKPWYHSKVGDNVALSKYPITETFDVEGNGVFLIDLRPHDSLLLIVAHTPCCDKNTERQYEIDAMMAFVRDAKAPGGRLDLEPDTPILVIGDMNLVGDVRQLRTLLTGDIVNRDRFGTPFAPDWDGTPLADLSPHQTELPVTYTWYRDRSTFTPGRLDFILYTDSVLDVGNRFILFTCEMSSDSLTAYGLQLEDVIKASDHLPVVGDFIFR